MWKYQWTQLGSENMHCQLFAFRFHRCWKLWRCLTEVSTVPNQEERRGILKVLPVQTLFYFHSQSTTESIKLQTGYKMREKSKSVPSGTGIPRTGIPHQLPFVFWSVKTGYERSKVLMSAILETRWVIILVRIGSRKMSDRKAELERKRKRLEEIKKAREEKKKVRNAEGETISLIQYFTSWMWTANWFWRLGRNHSGFRDWLHVCDKCYAWETYLVTWNRYVRDFFNVEIRKTSVACICRLDGPVASLTLSRYM